ncbi:peptidoglycan O-acetyltransferase [Flavobacteriaceae bacterium UJ101]|nr:peptidoglycan O-acetyltransferase [Flavobacteriaceae bacterium UJ101]
MLFNSIEFALFLPIVFLLYWYIFNNKLKYQNIFLLVVSYIFYGWWDWRFLFLIAFSTIVDFTIGLLLEKTKHLNKRKLLLSGSLIVNLGLLGFFKYYNFFVDSFVNAFTFFGSTIQAERLNIILPVGISFYTFQTLSYTIDVYRKQLKPTHSFIDFAAFVSFFPQLVAGPIERASNLLPQFYKKRIFEYDKAVDGLRQILWGLFTKIVIADNCAVVVNDIFSNYQNYSSIVLFLGGILFAFQIYGDFSGYSNIAIGVSKLFGFNLMQNFAFPYFSRDIAEFWRRWHISLSTWFRDYLYIPLGGSRGGTKMKIRNTFIIFLVSGFWHGANWTFIVWGALNALYFLPLLLANKNRSNLNNVAENRVFPTFNEIIKMGSTFILVVFGWIFFRAENVSSAFTYIKRIFVNENYINLKFISFDTYLSIIPILLIFLIFEWFNRKEKYGLENVKKYHFVIRMFVYYMIVFLINFYSGQSSDFIYFQF